jgi:hypothetical protein
MSKISKLFKTAGTIVCMGAVFVGYQMYERKTASAKHSRPLSAMEIKIRDHHRYWDEVSGTTNACVSDAWFYSKSPSDVYEEMPRKLKEIPTGNIDPDTVKTVQKYLAPGLARLSNFNQMESELAGKIVLSIGLTILTAGVSDAADAADGVDAVATMTDIADGITDVADLANVTDAADLASVTDAIDAAGGLEAVIGKVPGKGLLGISSTIQYLKEKRRIPGIRHIVEYRTERARNNLEKRYGGTFPKINLDLPRACQK